MYSRWYARRLSGSVFGTLVWYRTRDAGAIGPGNENTRSLTGCFCCGRRIRTFGLRVMSPTSYRCSIPRDSFYSLATHRAARLRTSFASDLAPSEEQRDPLLQPCHRRTIRTEHRRARILLHADQRLARQHVSVVTRLVHHVVVGLLHP